MTVLLLTICLHVIFWMTGGSGTLSNDIHDIWMAGHRLSEGINPYAQTLGGDMRHNNNYATYLPLSYLFSAALHFVGLRTLEGFLLAWRPLSLACHLAIGVIVYREFSLRGNRALGLCAASLVLLGRWSTYLIESTQLEFAAILPLLIATHMLHGRPRMAGLLLGVSLAIKQIGLLVLPLMIFQLARSRSRLPVRHFLIGTAAVPLVTSLPFIIWSFTGFTHSILFSLTRVSMGHPETGVAPVNLFGLDGTRVFMFFLITVIWWMYRQGALAFWCAASFIILSLTQFNPVVFTQYYAWLLVFLLMALAEGLPAKALRPSPTLMSPGADFYPQARTR